MRLKMLNGAPLCEHLDFNNDTLLAIEECYPFGAVTSNTTPVTDSTPFFKWRGLPFINTRLQTEWSQPFLPGSVLGRHMSGISLPNVNRYPSFVQEDTTHLNSSIAFEDPSIATPGYLEHSLIFHDTLLSSQVLPDDLPDKSFNSSSFLTTSFGTTVSGLSSPSKVDEHALLIKVPLKMTVTPLGSLPSAQHLRAMYPQTPTPSFICAITATPEQKEVFVRKGGYKMKLWEIMVADDTRSDFKVTFWLRPPRKSNNEQNHVQHQLLQTLESIKAGDVLLLRNIALTSFGDTVFGQSLNPAITRARTAIDVLTRSNGISTAQAGGFPAPVVETFKRVKKWARLHIASDSVGSRKRKGSRANQDKYAEQTFAARDFDDSMPPDTMDNV